MREACSKRVSAFMTTAKQSYIRSNLPPPQEKQFHANISQIWIRAGVSKRVSLPLTSSSHLSRLVESKNYGKGEASGHFLTLQHARGHSKNKMVNRLDRIPAYFHFFFSFLFYVVPSENTISYLYDKQHLSSAFQTDAIRLTSHTAAPFKTFSRSRTKSAAPRGAGIVCFR